MTTYKKFYDDVYLKEYTAKVIKAEAINDMVSKPSDISPQTKLKYGLSVELDETIFFPLGGGQSCDLGTIEGFKLVSVEEDKDGDGIEHVYHRMGFESEAEREAAMKALEPGKSVKLLLDWPRRFDNMQRHCGEHILSGIFFREYGGVNRGFHMGDDYMTIDISMETLPEYTELTYEMCKHVELCANEVIWSNAPVIRRVFATAKECEGLPLRKKLAFEKDISIVCVGSIENAADCVACCGTHPATAGQVGLIKIFKVEVNKSFFRVYCEAGRRAYLDYEFKHDFFTHMGNRLSATKETIYEQLKHDDDKISSVRNELYHLKKSVVAERSSALNRLMRSGDSIIQSAVEGTLRSSDDFVLSIPGGLSGGGNDGVCEMLYSGLKSCVLVKEFNDFSIDDLFEIEKQLEREVLPKLLILVTRSANACVLISAGKGDGKAEGKNKGDGKAEGGKADKSNMRGAEPVICGNLVKENASIYGGKGGGRDNSARAIFPDGESLDMFVKLLKTHLLGKYQDI